MSPLEIALRKHPKTRDRLRHKRDTEAAEAAIQFFCDGRESRDENWYGSVTWRKIMEAFAEVAPTDDTAWFVATNDDPGWLRTGDQVLSVGQVVEIEGEEKKRYVTSTTGSPGRYYAYFKNQGPVPVQEVRWRTVAVYSQTSKPVTIPVGQPRSLATRIKEHWLVSSLGVVVVAVITLGSLTDAVSKIKVSLLDKVIESVRRPPPPPPVNGQEPGGLSPPQTQPANDGTKTEKRSTGPAIEAVPKESPSHRPGISITSPLNGGTAEYKSKDGMTLVAVEGQSLGLTTSDSILLTVTASDSIEYPQWLEKGVHLASDGMWSGHVQVGKQNERPIPGNEYKLKAYVLPKDLYDECKRKAPNEGLIWRNIKSGFPSSEPITFRLSESKP